MLYDDIFWPWHVYVGDIRFVSAATVEMLYIYIYIYIYIYAWWFGFRWDVASISWIYVLFACFIALIEIGRYTEYMSLTEESHVMVCRALIREVKDHRNNYMRIYKSKDCYNYILNRLHPPENRNGIALLDKWLTLPNMSHIVATHYNMVVAELTNHEIGISKTFFPIKGRPPINPKSHIMCVLT
jgi:hypothetical protein